MFGSVHKRKVEVQDNSVAFALAQLITLFH